jgi:two-component system sensor histidine kinase PhoQ
MLGVPIDFPAADTPGNARFATLNNGPRRLLALSLGIEWEDDRGRVTPYTFSVAEDLATLRAEISGFRRTLWGWFGASVVLLMVVQGSILRWSLRPLRRVGEELADIEDGSRERLGSAYPAELAPLTQGINRFIAQEQARLEHYRRGLGDLAHSLKTPLAVLRGALEARPEAGSGTADAAREIDRMAAIVEYHLQRAATAGRRPLAAPVDIAPIVARVTDSLAKVHRDKGVECTIAVAAECRYRAEEGDLYELLGNLADNAFKWCRSRVWLQAGNRGDPANPSLWLCVEDDGPGLPQGEAERLAQRGQRADASIPGHGLGLAMVNDLVSAYAGTLEIGHGETGGARIEVRLPG